MNHYIYVNYYFLDIYQLHICNFLFNTFKLIIYSKNQSNLTGQNAISYI